MKKLFGLLLGLLLIFAVSGSANATTIFEDDFDRDNNRIIGNGWSEIEDASNDVAIENDYLLLRDQSGQAEDAGAFNSISTVGFTDIGLSFDWRENGRNEGSEMFHVSWSDGVTWTEVWSASIDNVTPFVSVDMNLTGAEGRTDFGLMLWTDGTNGAVEGVRIDNVVLYGMDPVPEPATMLLFGLGLLGLAGVSRKK